MTRKLCIAAAVTLALSLSACGRDDNRDTAPYGPTSSTNTDTGGPSSPSGGPLVTGEVGTSSSAATGGTSGMGAAGAAAGGTSTPGAGATGSGTEAADSSTSPSGNIYGSESGGITPDAERSKRR